MRNYPNSDTDRNVDFSDLKGNYQFSFMSKYNSIQSKRK